MTFTLLIVVILLALIFEYINGFHDAANAIATVVSTKVLTPRSAIIMGGIFEFTGAFFGTHVAKTIGAGIIDVHAVTQLVIISALLGAIVWNLITWYFGLPSSSSHALVGGLIGAAITYDGVRMVNVKGFTSKVLIPMISSPLIGFIFGLFLMLLLFRLFHHYHPDKINKYFRKLQLISAAFMAFGHGSNDAQKTMGIITMALVSYHAIPTFIVPTWVICICALTMGMGTTFGGWRIIRTMGTKVFKLKPIHGFAAQTTASSVIIMASHLGIPVSTTHVVTSSIMGVGSTVRFSAVKWGIVGNIVWAWVLTIPICALIASLFYVILNNCFN